MSIGWIITNFIQSQIFNTPNAISAERFTQLSEAIMALLNMLLIMVTELYDGVRWI
jgi:hypothetical protein